jgi:hypothetical protein
MELSEALSILQCLYAPLYGDSLRIIEDHICNVRHSAGHCPYGDSAKYTRLDALLDDPDRMVRRLEKSALLKP